LAIKKEQANENAHKAIVHVVTTAGQKASRKAARLNAVTIQQSFVSAACHRHVQHKMRQAGEDAKASLAERGLSPSAQLEAEVKALNEKSATIVNQTVSNTVRRQAHLSAMNAKKEAQARGLSKSRQINAARQAWKAAEPKIVHFCQPSAEAAAKSELDEPGKAPEAINQHKFVVNAVQAMHSSVSKACNDATGPVVIDGAKLAEQHDADYDFQVREGMKEAYKVCNATTKLYTENAEQMSKKMVSRSFNEDADEKRRSTLFEQQLHEDAEDKVKRAEDKAEQETHESMNKQCEKKTEEALRTAKNQAARSAVSDLTENRAKSEAQAAYDRAHQEALSDGLSEQKATELAKAAYDKHYAETQAAAQAATKGVAPPPPSTPQDLEELQTELQLYTKRAHAKRAKEAHFKKVLSQQPASHSHSAAEHAQQEASEAEQDVSTIRKELQQMEVEQAAQEIAVPTELLSQDTTFLLSLPDEIKAQKQKKLVHAIAQAVKSLHHLGGHLPSELKVLKLQAELQAAKARIAELEGAKGKA